MGFNEAFLSVKNLVSDFKENEKAFLKSDYSEADVRNDFINKFFISLGWDVRHEQQKNPYEQEVRVEKPVQVAKAQKRADYTFYLSPNFRDVKFFVEAKKPFHDLENKDYFFQTVRYGWNANTPIAVLTDFEEFIILDCRYQPDINDILNYKIKRFHYSDYADEEKFKEIYFLFSRQSVADNSLEKYADSQPKPKGKKKALIKSSQQKIDEAFLVELDEIRTTLAKSFKKNNTHLTSEELTEATQRTIDRLVFIKFLEDKMIEPHHYISDFVKPHPNPSPSKGEGLVNSLSLTRRGIKSLPRIHFGGEVDFATNGKDAKQKSTAWEKFVRSSITLDAKYNGVVFKKCLIDSRNIIEPDDKTFSAICEELSHENTPYNFDIIPIHILGSIYERFLGKVVNATDKRVTIEDKPEVRKAGGVYYTPQYIVNYIVDNTIGKLIAGKTPKEIAKMRFADIACGSGSFLITVYERLLDYHKRWYIENPEQAKKDGCVFYEGAYRLSLQQKQHILTNNIYGVDLDSQAVEVTQLSLYLKLLEDETTATANDTWVMFKEKLLPDLNKNIINGNSLIGTDILDLTLQFPLLQKESTSPLIPLLRKERGRGEVDELKLKPMDFEKVFPEVMASGGFDAIVGNPPYVRGEQLKDIRNYLGNNFEQVFNGTADLYVYFIYKAIVLLKANGQLGYIVSNKFTKANYGQKLREFIVKNYKITEYIDQFSERVFKQAAVDPCILILKNEPPSNKSILLYNQETHLLQSNLNKSSWNFLNDNLYKIKSKVEINGKAIKLFENVNIYFGIKSGFASAYIIDKQTKERLQELDEIPDDYFKKLLRGRDVKRYEKSWDELFLIDIRIGRNIDKFENLLAYFKSFKKQLENRTDYRPGVMKWFNLRPCSYYDEFEKPKILYPDISERGGFCWDDENYYFNNTIYMITNAKKYWVGILNSSLISWYYKQIASDLGKKGVRYFKQFVELIPICELSDLEIIQIESLVSQMLTAKKQLQQAKTESDKNYLERKCDSLDKQIDELVYELYGLTEEEIKIVEG
ncbi:MAG TPA: TaqI-like C-terminal specificity domain-containing protein [Ignavibacteriaceae bacterium]|nr:TaqI-like C-terminal specificity domain-containing protein [Ignavibacteriaceae bacterium]